ncbi:hypothetical protein Pan258_50970 [Symmachiella dynata]|uniref:hypothetical protein n=1 Tax=Symmachiella dynata TaxID=2527995 RepID=UPI00118B708C|nr:hypothetical protein [Symmachiella dynata]QDT51014.1 hypothetical protein Pan258_50970 [Symmachiella dynata]
MNIVNFLYLATACMLLAEPVKVTDVENQVLAGRRELRSGTLDIVAVTTDREGRPATQKGYLVDFEDDKLRFDYSHSRPQSNTDGDVASYKEILILTPEGLITHVDPETTGENWAVSRIAPEDLQSGSTAQLFDPRLLGINPSVTGMLHSRHLESFVGNPERTSVTVESEEIDGREVSRVEYLRTDGFQARMWIDPDRGYNIIRAEFQARKGAEERLFRIDCELKQYETGGIWFPEVIKYQELHDGKLFSGETVTIRSATFNMDVDDDRFTVATMNLPPGTAIADTADNPNGTQMWNGTELVRVPNRDLKARDIAADSEGKEQGRPWIFRNVLVLSNLVVVILVVGLYFYWRRQKSHSS